ncbi:energy-coupling factor transporter transmembrane component T [Apilactobacillus ozensis]|uniref:ABC transporter integral membrane subunit n=1 Tax=Apilactobacillus ozensis DSM 23829 = JCM 17196 TaxID=1423781 RepID=A0A0R2B176_9LACO|nr:energy-coupling factor transporter transmembrane component T [Apilactobacillus ozensis]KRM69849.1 ABC transporter integral membrane subunit [Apilactobacillus ozensis DSM 23829 = JCM 17196]MCK8606735.1 energy-coupling factor transporter transmembrane protein EcfT [Apilactobacillus ozensis]
MSIINPSIKLITILLIALEISFTQNIITNLVLICCSILYLIFHKAITKGTLLVFTLAIIPSIGIVFSQNMYGNSFMGTILVTRLYAYIALGMTITKTTTIKELCMSFEQNLHMPTKFVYGFMGGFNLISYIKQDILDIKQAAYFRNMSLHFWSPSLYFKAIVSAIHYSELLAEGMESHGFSENSQRTHYQKMEIKRSDYVFSLALLIAVQIFLFYF